MPRLQNWLASLRFPVIALAASTLLLTLAFAPVSQFYLAWVGLVPWLLLLSRSRSKKSAFFLSWIAGTLFFTANMWWMAIITGPGMIALMLYCGLYWALAGLLIRASHLLDPRRNPLLAILGIASIWIATEWLRSVLINGLPWLFLGHTQSPLLVMCQIADITGVYGISFWIVAVNALITLIILRRPRLRSLIPAAITVVAMLVAILAYGIFRLQETPQMLSSGPVVVAIQANFPQSNSGTDRSGTAEDWLNFYDAETRAALSSSKTSPDLIVWSETAMPALNHEIVELANETDADNHRLDPSNHKINVHRQALDAISKLASTHHIPILTGGAYWADYTEQTRDGQKGLYPTDNRNTVYLFDREGRMDDSLGKRYDKIHLVPWGEYIPLINVPFIEKLSKLLGPDYYEDYILHPGEPDAMTVFQIGDPGKLWKFVTPICFEDIDGPLCARMIRPEAGEQKRADFIVNVTNDGWFLANENAQHLQVAIFRSIENRVPTARSVNTGISGFIDSTGHTSDLLPPRTTGHAAARLMLDRRIAFYTRWGDLFADICIAATIGMLIWSFGPKIKRIQRLFAGDGPMKIQPRLSTVLTLIALGASACASKPKPAEFHAPPPPPAIPTAPQASAKPLNPALQDSARSELLNECDAADPFLRSNAIEAVGEVAPDHALEPILHGLNDPEPTVRFAAAVAAGQLRIKEANATLVAHVQDSDLRVQAAVRFALHRLGDTRFSHDLEKFATDFDSRVRGTTAFILGLLQDPSATNILTHLLSDPSPAVRIQAAEALWRLGDQRGLSDLVAFSISGYPDDQMVALIALAEPHDQRIIEHVRGNLISDYPEVSLAAARALGMLGSDAGYDIAVAGAKSQDPRQRALAALAMGAIGRSDLQKYLSDLLKDSDPQVRISAATGILQLRSSSGQTM